MKTQFVKKLNYYNESYHYLVALKNGATFLTKEFLENEDYCDKIFLIDTMPEKEHEFAKNRFLTWSYSKGENGQTKVTQTVAKNVNTETRLLADMFATLHSLRKPLR